MLKRAKDVAKTGRKRRKGNTTYQISTLDRIDDDKSVVEDIRVWDISTSEKTGRVMAKRRTLRHRSQVSSSLPDEPSTSGKPGSDAEVTNVEETGNLADTESSSGTVNKPRPKQKCTRVARENDSVSGLLALPALALTRILQTKMEQWLKHRPVILDELLRLDGLGDALDGPRMCPDCMDSLAQIRCNDCFGGIMRCPACIVSSHQNFPLHRIQVRQASHTMLA